jgi:hypothetical protein
MPEDLSKNLPDPIVRRLLEEPSIDQPSSIVNSMESSLALPQLSDSELQSVMADFHRIAQEAQVKLDRMHGGDPPLTS